MVNITPVEQLMAERAVEFDKTISHFVSEYVFPKLRDPSLHLIRAGGKRMRPFITSLCAEGFGCDINFVLPLTASIELMHTASLIHDDVIDNCTIRRGVPSVHVKWDVPTAILAGDALLSVAVRATATPVMKSNVGGISLSYISDDFINHLNLFSNFWGEICEGKQMDREFTTDLTEEVITTLNYKKTAVLFELAAMLGASTAGASEESIDSLSIFGKNIGLAFQLQDDILGLVGDESVLGKNVGVDITNGKKTLILCHFLNNAPKSDQEIIKKALCNQNIPEAELSRAIGIIEDAGSVDYVKGKAVSYIEDAKKHLDVIPGKEQKDLLAELSDYIIRRVK